MNIQILESFLNTADKKGYVTSSVSKQTRSALDKVKRIVQEEEAATDLTKPGAVEEVFKRFLTKFPDEITSDSANVYVSRIKKAVDNCSSYQKDPLNYRPTFSQGNGAKSVSRAKKTAQGTKELNEKSAATEEKLYSPQPGVELFETAFPLRKNYMLPLALPKDLTTIEVKRMAYYLLTLCSDFNPGTSNIWQHEGPASTPSLPRGH